MPPQKPPPEARAANQQLTHLESRTATYRESEELIPFAEAARILSMSQRNLRKVIRRSRERIEGRLTSGPVIRFFQCQPKGAIKFRRSWLDEFIQANSHDPKPQCLVPPKPRRRKKKESTKRGHGPQGDSSGMAFGFDAGLYEV